MVLKQFLEKKMYFLQPPQKKTCLDAVLGDWKVLKKIIFVMKFFSKVDYFTKRLWYVQQTSRALRNTQHISKKNFHGLKTIFRKNKRVLRNPLSPPTHHLFFFFFFLGGGGEINKIGQLRQAWNVSFLCFLEYIHIILSTVFKEIWRYYFPFKTYKYYHRCF